MKTRVFNYMLLAALMLGMGSAVTSCKDDDDKNLTPEEQEAKQEKEDLASMTFWRVAGQLCNGCEVTANWQDARLEANIGEASSQSEATRLVFMNDANAALKHFSGLIGTELPDYTISYDWTLGDAGSMTYRKQNDGTAWATVDVDIKQVPGLKRIVYCSPEQQGLNGYFAGTAYYHFGDVIKKKNEDGNDEYWMCVRPMFGPEKKQDMHWVSLSDLPSKNIEKYVASTGDTYFLPTKLSSSYNSTHWQNAAEMLFAIMYPQKWRDNIESNPKLDVFSDFRSENLRYHNQYFWERVKQGWLNNDIFQKVMHYDYEALVDDMQSIRFIYSGYSWHWNFFWDLTLWAYEYSGKDNNFHTVKYITKKDNVKGKPFDVHNYGKFGRHDGGYVPFEKFTYPCRYATGKQLAGFTPKEYSTIASATNGIEDVYLYNREYDITPGQGNEPEVCEQRTYSYILPGTVIREKETGKLWICYAGWYDDGQNIVGDYKVRFISFDNTGYNNESYSVNEESKTGKFKNDNLIPEDEAPMAMAFLFNYFKTKEGGNDYVFNKACSQYQGVNIKDFVITYDTIMPPNKDKKDHIYAFSMIYEQKGGRKSGTQPYLRMVADYSNNSTRAQQQGEMQYLHYYFYKFYNDINSLERLDLTHLFDGGAWLGDQYIEADRWSNCWLTGTGQRNGNFTKEKCYPTSYLNYYYTYSDNQWLFTKNGNNALPEYTDAYYEPVVMASYMVIDDSSRSSSFPSKYNGKTYELVSSPSKDLVPGLMAMPLVLKAEYNGHSFMDDVPFNPIK